MRLRVVSVYDSALTPSLSFTRWQEMRHETHNSDLGRCVFNPRRAEDGDLLHLQLINPHSPDRDATNPSILGNVGCLLTL